jgi:surfactin family lipopeptide synthetase A
MILCQAEYVGSPKDLLCLIKKERVSCLHFVPGMLNAFIFALFDLEEINDSLKSLRMVIASGESLAIETVMKWYKKVDIPIHNLYGPTEASIEVTCYTTSQYDTKIPIGRPISNTRIYILGKFNQLLPIGVTGEICISGHGLARGYINNEEATAEKFVVNPFAKGERMYKTGDLGRWLPDGNIEFCGRNDGQVKIRGYRIELGEIESVLNTHPKIDSAFVVSRETSAGEKELVAYILSKEILNTAIIRSFISKTLPAYMLPGYIIQVDAWPLGPNGKIDRKSLPDPVTSAPSSSANYVAPGNATEEKLISIWQEVLGKEKIGIKDNFFDIGGTSIKIIQLSKLVSSALHCDISVAFLFQYPNIKDLVDRLKNDSFFYVEDEFDRRGLLDDLNKFNVR